MKILIFVDHDVIVRHFIHSGIFNPLEFNHAVTFVFPEVGNKRVTINSKELSVYSPIIHIDIHHGRQKFWKRLFQVDLLRPKFRRRVEGLARLHREMLGAKAALIYTILGFPILFQVLEFYTMFFLRRNPNREMEKILDEFQPDVVIHPTVLDGLFVNELICHCKPRNITTIYIMNSWDNPSTKRAVIGFPDYLFVWGEQTRQHAIKYMRIAPSKVIVFGCAQFDVYRRPARLTIEEFRDLNLVQSNDPDLILLYAGSSKGVDEFAHLVQLENAIENGEIPRCVVLYRPHPWGMGGRHGKRIIKREWQHVRIENSMIDYLERISSGDSSICFSDYRHTHEILSHVDAVVSPLSTILLESAMHGKPVMCFLPLDDTRARHLQLAAPLPHFDEMFEMRDYIVTLGEGNFLVGVRQLLEIALQGENIEQQMRQSTRYFVKTFSRPYGERLLEFCNSIPPHV